MTTMPEFRCASCGTYHEPPKCSWDGDTPCVQCGGRMGFAAYGQPDDGRCNRCWCAEDLGIVVPAEVAR